MGVVRKVPERVDELRDEVDVGEGVEQRPDMVAAAGGADFMTKYHAYSVVEALRLE